MVVVAWCVLDRCGFNTEVGMMRAVGVLWHMSSTCVDHHYCSFCIAPLAVLCAEGLRQSSGMSAPQADRMLTALAPSHCAESL